MTGAQWGPGYLASRDPIFPRLCSHLTGNLSCLRVGHLLVTREGERLRIVQAEPKILISVEVLDALICGRAGHEDVEVTIPDPPSWVGAVVTIRAVNQAAVYRIGDREAWDRDHPGSWSLFAMNLWPAEWPD